MARFCFLVFQLLIVAITGQGEPPLLWERNHSFGDTLEGHLQDDPREIIYSPVDDTLYVFGDVAFEGIFIEALDASTGETKSVVTMDADIRTGQRSNIISHFKNPETGAIDLLYAEGTLFTLEGEVLWKNSTYKRTIGEDVVFSSDGSVMYRNNRGNAFTVNPVIQAIDTGHGSLLWEIPGTKYGRMMLYKDSKLFVGYEGSNNFEVPTTLYGIDASSGEIVDEWTSDAETGLAQIVAAPVLSPDGKSMFVLDDGLILLSFDPENIGAGYKYAVASMDDVYPRFDNDIEPVLSADGNVLYGVSDTFTDAPFLRAVQSSDGSLLSEIDNQTNAVDNGPRSLQVGHVSGNIYVVRTDSGYVATPSLDKMLFNITISSSGGWWPHRFEFNADETIMYWIETSFSGPDSVRAFALSDPTVPPTASPTLTGSPTMAPTPKKTPVPTKSASPSEEIVSSSPSSSPSNGPTSSPSSSPSISPTVVASGGVFSPPSSSPSSERSPPSSSPTAQPASDGSCVMIIQTTVLAGLAMYWIL